jgi:hypothetical protein
VLAKDDEEDIELGSSVLLCRGGPRPMAAWATARGVGPNFF